MKKDLLQTAEVKKKDIVIFEINDTGRGHEFKAGHGYVDAFIGFLESLGYEPSRKYEHSTDIELDGISFGIGTGNASYMSRNAYTRDEYVRKSVNRWIGLEKGYDSIAAKVYINKEMDADKIKKQINGAIDAAKGRFKNIEDTKAQDKKNSIAIGDHYSKCRLVKRHCRGIYVEKGVLSFDLKGYSSIQIKADGSFLGLSLYMSKVESITDIPKVAGIIEKEMKVVEAIAKEITGFAKLSADLQEWTVKAYHVRYDVQKKKLFEY